MVRPLKKRNQHGVVYTRRPKIEKAIEQVLSEAPNTWPSRAKIADRDDPKYLEMEVLIHLIRHTLRVQDYSTGNALLSSLGERCARLLLHSVRDTVAFNASEVREETVSRLYELFADDLKDPSEGILDFFEVLFNKAFVTLRANVIREATAHAAPLVPLVGTDVDEAEGDAEPPELKELASDPETVVLGAEKEELHRLVQALPPEERAAVVWKHYYGYKTESTDSTEKTVATLCGVSGSEIRSRLRSAYARLKNWMEDKS